MFSPLFSFKKTPIAVIAGLLTLGLMPTISFAFDESETKEIEQIVRQYLVENPEILIEMSQALQAKQQLAEQRASQEGLSENLEELMSQKGSIVLGDPDAPFTVVEFYDYNCPVCRRSLDLLEATLQDHKDVKFILRDWPVIGGEQSMNAHRISIALHALRPDLFEKFHIGMMSANGRASGESARALALELGVDEAALDAKLADSFIDKMLNENNSLAEKIGARGVPALIIKDEFIAGAIPVSELEKRFENLRKCGATNCS